MRIKLWVAIAFLLVTTAIYPVVLHMSINRYEAWKRAEIERYNALGVFSSDAGLWLDFSPYIDTFEGGLLLILGVILAGCWLMIIAKRGKKNLLQSMKPSYSFCLNIQRAF